MLSYEEQDQFRALVRGELAKRRLTITKLAVEIDRHRATVQLAISRGMYLQTQKQIDAYLGLGFFKTHALPESK